jgi:putative chitinase
MKVDVFYKVCRAKLGSISKAAQGGFDLILREAGVRKTETNHLAYMLATAWWETAKTMQPVREAFFVAPNDFDKVEAWRRKKLHYYPYYGRGFVQLTWKTNYEKASKKFGVDFVKEPDRVMELQYAVPILFDGMAEGWFTGKALDDYIDDIDEPESEDLREYKEARRIINGTDKADTVARIAVIIEEALRQADYGTDAFVGFVTAESAGGGINPYSWIADGFGPGGPGDQPPAGG